MRYVVDFYDGFDGWIYSGGLAPEENKFDDLEEARKFRDKKNAELDQSNKDFGEHYGIIDTKYNQEVECCQHKLKTKTN